MCEAMMTHSSTFLDKTEKFDGTKYHTWCIKMQMGLIDRDLWNIVNGTERKPNRDQELITKWISHDTKALSFIICGLSDNQIHQVSSAKSSHEAWTRLKSIFGQTNSAARLFLRKKLYRLEMDKDTNVATHVNNIRCIIDQLSGANVNIEEEESVFVLLASMPHAYESCVSAIANQANLTLASVASSLILEETRMESNKESSPSTPVQHERETALIMEKKKPPRVCYYCRKKGHMIKDCRKRIRDEENGTSKPKNHEANVATATSSEQLF